MDGARFDPETGSWSNIAALPTPVEYGSTAVVGGVLYVWSSGPDNEPPSFMAWDPATDRWERLATPNGELTGTITPGLGGEVLLVQGSHGQGRHPDFRYDPTRREWTPLPQDPLPPSFDRDLTVVRDELVLTAQDISKVHEGPTTNQAASWTEADSWRRLPAGDVLGWDPNWIAVGDLLINPTPGGSDGGSTNPYGRVLPYGGILDLSDETWSALPDDPGDHLDHHFIRNNIGDEQLLVSTEGWALEITTGRWHAHGAPGGGPDEGAASSVHDGRLYVFGGARWRAGNPGELIDAAWAWDPTAQRDARSDG